jgi:uncharacterized protein YxeA
MEPDSADYKATVEKFDTAGNTLFDEFKHKDPNARAVYSKPSSGTTQPQDNTALANALGLNQTATSANKKSATATIQLLCIKRNSDTTITVPKDIQPGIIANITKGTTATTYQQLNTNIKKYHNNAKEEVYTFINILARWQDKNKAWWSLVTTAYFQTDHLATALIINDTTAFNVFNNVHVDQESSHYKTDQESEQLQQRAQTLAGWEKKEQTKSGTVATCNTNVVTFPDLMTALTNTALTFKFLETDILNSAVTNLLSIIPDSAETLMRALHTDAAQACIENMQHYPHIPFDILRRFGTGIAMLTSWATDPQRNTTYKMESNL